MVVSLRVRHQAEHATGRVANAGDIVDRTVRVVRKLTAGRLPVRSGITHDHLLARGQAFDDGRFGMKFSFSVSHRQIDPLDPPGKNAG